MKKRYVVVLAAGQGTRMKSKLYKVMHPVMGKPMVGHVVQAAIDAKVDQIITVTGFGAETVQNYLGDRSEYVFQKEQLGTAHAVDQARSFLADKEGTTLVLSGDTPLIQAETIKKLMDEHEEKRAKATILTAHAEDPYGYGRVIRSDSGQVAKVVEEKDADETEKEVQEINTGTYCFDNKSLFKMLEKVDNNNAQGEYYLPDVIELLKNNDGKIGAYQLENMDEALGVNDRVALSEATKLMIERINTKHMLNGVTLVDPKNTYIEASVQIGQDTTIEPGTFLKGNTVIENNVKIGLNSEIVDSQILENAEVTQSVIKESTVGNYATIGPYSHLRPGTVLHEKVHVGNYVEIKNSIINKNTKIGHHAYVGDAQVGMDVNIGCGVIFANYDGKKKSKSFVGDNSFIGSNVTLVAPITLGDRTIIAAGSTITEDVEEEALGIARGRQSNKEGFYTNYFK